MLSDPSPIAAEKLAGAKGISDQSARTACVASVFPGQTLADLPKPGGVGIGALVPVEGRMLRVEAGVGRRLEVEIFHPTVVTAVPHIEDEKGIGRVVLIEPVQ